MGGSNNTAQEGEGGGEVGDPQGGFRRGQAHRDQQHRDDCHSEKFEDAFHPDVDHKPTPVIGQGEVGSLTIEEPESVKSDDQDGAEHIKPDECSELILMAEFKVRGHGPVNDQDPENQTHKK